jgi:hypothetical protein
MFDLVIPANAGIQFKYVVRSTQNLMSSATHVIRWDDEQKVAGD